MRYLRIVIAVILSLAVHILFFFLQIDDYDNKKKEKKSVKKMEIVLNKKNSKNKPIKKNMINEEKKRKTKSSKIPNIEENIDNNKTNHENVDNSEGSKLSTKNPTNIRKAKINFKKPEYPYISRIIGEEGTVVIEVVIGKNNNIISVNVVKSSGYKRLDKAVVNQVKNGKVKSAKKNGENIVSKRKLGPFKFKLND